MRDIVRKRILEKFKYKCNHCGAVDKLEVDHIIPLSKGGRHDEDNMQILCKTCNLKKRNHIDYSQYFITNVSDDYILVNKNIIELFPYHKPNEIIYIFQYYSMIAKKEQ